MPQNKTINSNMLTAGACAYIKGRVTYSHIKTKIEGDALKRDQEKARLNGRIPKDRPYTTISICDAQIIPSNGPNTTLTVEEQYAYEHMYPSKNPDTPGLCFTGNSSGALPNVGEFQADGDVKWLEELAGELATGLDVTLVMMAFKGNPNMGFGLNAVIVNEPIKYFGGRRPIAPGLNKIGYRVTSEPPVRQQVAGPDDMPLPDDPYAGGSMPPPPQPAPVAPPTGDPYMSRPQPAGQAPAGFYPNAPAQPETPAAPVVQAPPAYGPFQPAAAPAPAPAPASAPVAGYPEAPGGIGYSPANDPNRQY